MNSDFTDIKQQIFSQLGHLSKLKGSFHFCGVTRLNGAIEGDIFIDTESTLYIERRGSIKGNIIGHQIEIFGRVEGDIQSAEKVIIHSSGVFQGTLKTQKLVVHPGAIVNIEAVAGQ